MKVNSNQIQEFIKINEEWVKYFKGDLIEDILDKYEDLKLFMDTFHNEWLPIWIESNKELTILYLKFKESFNKLDKEKLRDEYTIVRKLYMYALEKECDISSSDLKGIVNWIIEMYQDDEDEEITFEKLKDILDEQLHYE